MPKLTVIQEIRPSVFSVTSVAKFISHQPTKFGEDPVCFKTNKKSPDKPGSKYYYYYYIFIVYE